MTEIKEDEIKFYGECHNSVKNAHKYYLVFKDSEQTYKYKSAYGRIPGYGSKGTAQFFNIPSLREANTVISKKRTKYIEVSEKPQWLRKMDNIVSGDGPNIWVQLQKLLNNG